VALFVEGNDGPVYSLGGPTGLCSDGGGHCIVSRGPGYMSRW